MSAKPVGQRQTKQRDAIFLTIRESDGPLTVEAIHERAAKGRENLGKATVYRNVKLLLDAGEIQAVVLPDGQTRYEAADLGHHDHFRCRICDDVIDLDHCPVSIPEGTTLPGGYRVEGHELTLFGVCPQCTDKT